MTTLLRLYLPSIPEWDSFTLDETDGYIHFLGYLNGDITEEGILGLCFDNLTCNIFPLKYRYVNCLPPYKSKEMDDNFRVYLRVIYLEFLQLTVKFR